MLPRYAALNLSGLALRFRRLDRYFQMIFDRSTTSATTPKIALEARPPRGRLAVTRVVKMPNGKSIKIIRRDVLKRALQRTSRP
jgi:hypothetical protein